MPPRLRLPHYAVVGAAALVVMLAGAGAGFTARGASLAEPPAATTPAPPRPAETTPAAATTAPPAPRPMVPLRTLAAPHGLKLGSAVNTDALGEADYGAVLAREFSTVTAENAMKWRVVEPERGEVDRRAADLLLAFAEGHDQQVYGHTLVWHKQLPGWLHQEPDSYEETRELLRERVQGEVSYFRDRVWAWDVVNEPLRDDGTLRESLWLNRLGPDYIADAFRWAREADPEVSLFINDFGIEGVNAKSDALYHLVSQLLSQGVPIDGVGFQVHWTLDPLPASFVENLERFAALDLDVAITEMDVRLPEPPTPAALEQQAEIYGEAMDACLAVRRCVSFTVWGFTDAYSWVPHAYPGYGAAALFDDELNPKPAYAAVAAALRPAAQ